MNLLSKKLTEECYPTLILLWERSIFSTHAFLKETDLQEIKKQLPHYFNQLPIFGWYFDNELIGFSGVYAGHLEMLFLDPTYQGKGYGSEILTRLVNDFQVNSIDVNEDNHIAYHFYKKHGFSVFKRDETDSQGRAYPILHLKK